jgi:hypothetical protein
LPEGRPGTSSILCVLVMAFAYASAAEGTARSRHAAEAGSSVGSGREAVLEARVEDQEAALRQRIEEITAIGSELESAQARAEDARTRVAELGRQTRQLEEQLAEQDRLFREARREYRDRVRAAYKGESLEGFAAFLGGWFGVVGDPTVAAVLLENRQRLLAYEEAGEDLRNTRRRISQKQDD